MEPLLLQYSYWALLPLTIIEGPIVTIIASFFASLGDLNVYIVYIVALTGDIVGDIIHYWVGKYSRNHIIHKIGNYIGVTHDRLEQIKTNYFDTSSSLWKVITLSKISHAPSSLVMITAGMLKINFKQYLVITTVNNIFKVLVFVLIGYFFGGSYALIREYVEYAWIILLPLFLLIIYVIYGRK